MDGVRSNNIFEALNQPSKSSKDSTEKAPAKSAEKKAKKAEAAKTAAPVAAKAAPVRTGNKRGGFANKGTRPGSAAPGTRDNRGKRVFVSTHYQTIPTTTHQLTSTHQILINATLTVPRCITNQ